MIDMKERDEIKVSQPSYDEIDVERWHIPSIEEMKESGEWDKLSEQNKRVLEESSAFARSEEGKKYFEFLMSGLRAKETQTAS